MGYCAPRGIPHSVFLGWDADDRDKALSWHLHELERCHSCGTRPEEFDAERGGDRNAYTAEPHFCRGCEIKAQGDEKFEKTRGRYRRGTRMTLRRQR